MSKSFRAAGWDPLLIIAQIVGLQAAWYASASVVVLVAEVFSGSPVTLRHLLDFRELRLDSLFGWLLLIAHLSNAALGCYLLLIVVQRAKQCLDFACTLYLFHFIFTSIYSRHLPDTLIWWLLAAASIAGMAVGGEYLCMRRELEPIDVGRSLASRKRQSSGAITHGDADGVELSLLESGETIGV
ncbi:integral membrane protein S linking to the trans Golgi network-domain-containing protein [Hyaloraphidium curvatum]|nr:integral membrane protein S linking to the trans Golgi network-domain-containing protein [Hyaloraphidium curvatum]